MHMSGDSYDCDNNRMVGRTSPTLVDSVGEKGENMNRANKTVVSVIVVTVVLVVGLTWAVVYLCN